MIDHTIDNAATSASDAKMAPAKGRLRKRLSRAERANDAREVIFAAAAEVVGEHGYASASISRITEAAGIAQGTFYLYFESRQTLFDELLPHVGLDMLHFIRDRVVGATDVYDMEERGFRAFFKYLQDNPGFYRILNEAEGAAPVAHKKHFKLLTDHYIESLERSVKSGQIRHFERGELEAVAYVLMGARSYLYLRYVKGISGRRALPEKVIRTYVKLVRDGLK